MNITWHLPTLQERGCGLSTRALRLAEQLQSYGHKVSFVVDAGKTDITADEIGGMPLRRVKISPSAVSHWSLQAMAKRRSAVEMVRKIGRGHDLLLSGQPEVVAAYASLAERRPVVFVCGGTTLLHDYANRVEQNGRSFFGRIPFRVDRAMKHRNESQAFSMSDACIFDSLHTRDRVVAEYGISSERCHTVHGGVDDDAFRPVDAGVRAFIRRELGLSDEAFVVVWTGRLSPEKNVELLILATAHCERRPNRVYVVGEGPDRSDLETLCHQIGSDEIVSFTGLQPDVRPYLHAADVFVFPSRGESFGGSLVEAMACGLPCVTVRSDGREIRNASAEIIEHGESGWVVDGAEPGVLARALDQLAADAPLRARLGVAARRKASTSFSWKRGGEDLNRLLCEMTGLHPGEGTEASEWVREDRLCMESATTAEG